MVCKCHAHIVARDRYIDTGKQTLRWSDSVRDRIKAGLPENAVEATCALSTVKALRA